ncbi:MAG: substrate-binding domain-containing protein [Mycetocola sp.]
MHQFMKTSIAVVTAAALLLLAGCAAPTPNTGGTTLETANTDANQATWDPTAWETADLCGDEPIKIGLHDGLAPNSWRKSARAVLEHEIAACPNVDPEIVYTSSNNNPQQVATDINAMVAAGVDVIISLDDFGDSELPAYRAAKEAGVTVIPYYGPIGGVPGEDYDANVYLNGYQIGIQMADWFGANVPSGNVVVVGDFATSTSSANLFRGVKEGLKQYPDLTLVGDSFLAGNYDPQTVSQAITGVIQQYGDIAAMATQGFTSMYVQPFIDNGLPAPAVAAVTGYNYGYCEYEGMPADARYPVATWEYTTQVIAPAFRRSLAIVNDLPWEEPLVISVPKFYDTTAEQQPVCDPTLPADADLTTGLTADEIAAALG